MMMIPISLQKNQSKHITNSINKVFTSDECEYIYFAIISIASIRSLVVGLLYIIVTSYKPGILCLTTSQIL